MRIGATTPGMVAKVLVMPRRKPAYLARRNILENYGQCLKSRGLWESVTEECLADCLGRKGCYILSPYMIRDVACSLELNIILPESSMDDRGEEKMDITHYIASSYWTLKWKTSMQWGNWIKIKGGQ